MADSVRALRDAVASLAVIQGVHAHLCEGDPRSAMVWSDQTQITVRLHAPGDDEIWVLAGSGLMAREIADSEGCFETEPLVVAILDGRAIEMFGPLHGNAQMVPLGWQVETAHGGVFAGGVANEAPAVPAAVAGPLAVARLSYWPPLPGGAG